MNKKYYIRFESMAGDWHYMIYKTRFLLKDEFIERWNDSEKVKIRVQEFNIRCE